MFTWIYTCVPRMSDSGVTAEILEKALDRWLHIDIYMFTWIHGYLYVPVNTWIYAYSRGCIPACRIHGYIHIHEDIYLRAAYVVYT
jgi:hypothetical protein